MQLRQQLVIAALIGLQVSGRPVQAEDTDGKISRMEKQIEELTEQIKILRRQRELDGEAAEAKVKEIPIKPKSILPDWVTSIRLTSDLRLRFDSIYAPDSDFVTRARFRPRLRLGGIATLKDDFEIGFRLASTPSVGKDSGGDPLSTNQTFEDNGSRKPVGVDWAFARWTPIHTSKWTGSIAAGKLENPPGFSENVFDVDYTPEGLAEQFAYKAGTNHTISAYFGQYMLDELQFGARDPYLFLEQLRLDSKWGQRINTSLGVSGLSIANPESLTTANVPDSNHGNTRTKDGVLVNDYQLLIADGRLTYNLESFPLYIGPFPVSLNGESIHNFGASRDNIAYSFGPSFGRVTQTGRGQKGNWEISYRYQELQGDANYEELTASDNGVFYRHRPPGEPALTSFRPTFFNGLNLRGHAFRVAYAPFDSLVLDARIWLNEPIRVLDEADKVQGIRLLFDAVWKF